MPNTLDQLHQMPKKVLYVERNENEFVSLEKVFRQIAAKLSGNFSYEFVKVPFGNRIWDTARNFISFRKPAADLYHITGHIHYIALLLPPRNTVLSIMDIRFVHLAPGLRRSVMKMLYLDLPVRRMKYITAISDETKREIIKYSGCEGAKIFVLPLPVMDHIFLNKEKPFDSVRPVILQVGTMENKNIPNLARALKGLSCTLRIVGRLSNAQSEVLKENAVEYQNVSGLDDEQLRLEYESADIVSFCSTYEGFGLPIIEGQIMKKPVITSDISPMNETAGDGAALVDPNDPESIREGIERIIKDAAYRQDLVTLGVTNAERFSAEAVAARYEELYKRVLNDASGS